MQSFNGVVKPLGEARPAWKVLRVLGNLLGIAGFDYDSSEQVRDEIAKPDQVAAKLDNRLGTGLRCSSRPHPADCKESPTSPSISATPSCAAPRRCSRPTMPRRRAPG